MPLIVLHIPHSSTIIPPDIRDQFIVTEKELDDEIRLMTDHFTDELFVSDDLKSHSIIFPISRICVDPERFVDDELESMSKRGMGVIYTHSHEGSRIRRDLSGTERQRLLDEYYYPHHERLETMVGEKLKKEGKCLIIDCHSFPSKVLPYEFDQSEDRPDICIGTDEFHTPQWLTEICVSLFESYGLTTAINRPFSGSLVPRRYYSSSKDVLSVMIEVNRKLYMDEGSANKNENFGNIQKSLKDVLESLQNECHCGYKQNYSLSENSQIGNAGS